MKNRLFLILLFAINCSNTWAYDAISKNTTLYPENIIKLTFENSDRIKAAYFNLEAAKFNFQLFESEYTRFNPTLLNAQTTGDSENYYSTELSSGISKEFFNGSSISASVGNNMEWTDNVQGDNISFIDAEVAFPLFTSSRKLNRLIKRTFEENELYTKNLSYVNSVKNNIKASLQQYYDLVSKIKIYNQLVKQRDDLALLIKSDSISFNSDDISQIESEIYSIDSDVTGWEITLYSLKLNMQRYMNLDNIDLDQLLVIEIDFTKDEYYGKYYIEQPEDSIFQKALINDTEFQVLGVMKNNAEEKKSIAEKGGFDIFATTGGRYNFYQLESNIKQNSYLSADAGIKIRLSDTKVLKNTIAKADADIHAIDYTIEDRKKLVQLDIEKLKNSLTKKKEQLITARKTAESWNELYATKKNLFTEGNESVDNFIQTFRSLRSSYYNLFRLENNYLDLIRNFDYVTGTYFEYIELQN